MIVVLISGLLYKIIVNNIFRNKITYKYEDMYDLNDMENLISEVNKIIEQENIQLDNLEETGEILNIGGNISLVYDKSKNKVYLVDIREERKEKLLDFKKLENRTVVIPVSRK